MGTIYGDALVFSYANEGGIALMSNDIPPGAIVGGSDDDASGSHQSYNRIYWWISYDEATGEYSGGITGYDWYLKGATDAYDTFLYGPFYGKTEQAIYEEASRLGSLDETFDAWNSTHQDEIAAFITYLQHQEETVGCVRVGTAG